MTKLEGLQEHQMPGESTGGQQCYAVERLTTSVQPFLGEIGNDESKIKQRKNVHGVVDFSSFLGVSRLY